MSEIDSSSTPTEIAEMPPLNPEGNASGNEELTTEDANAEQQTDNVQQADESAKEFEKRIQREQMKRANAERKAASKDAEIASLKQAISELKTQTTAERVDSAAELEAYLATPEGQQEASLVPGLAKATKALATELRNSRGRNTEDVKALQEKLENKLALVDHAAYWAQYPTQYKKDFDAKVKDLMESGDLDYATAHNDAAGWFKWQYVAEKAKSGKTATPQRAASSPGTRVVIPSGSGARQSPSPTAKDAMLAGASAGRNIGGVPFKK